MQVVSQPAIQPYPTAYSRGEKTALCRHLNRVTISNFENTLCNSGARRLQANQADYN